MTFVVDASVAIKWFIRESLHDVALRLLETPEPLHAVDLLAAEVANTAWAKVRRSEIGSDQAVSIVAAIRQGTPLLYPTSLFIERALDIAFALDHPVYDCLYLACAENLDAKLVTADDRFCRKAIAAGFADHIQPLRKLAEL